MIRIGIMGYGNLGRGVENAIRHNPDTELAAVFTRRDPASLKIATENVPVVAASEAAEWKDKIDVLILCGGSATDLPKMTPEYAALFNVVDSFDTHARIPEHFKNVDEASKKAGKVSVISIGWDPGLFSLNRVLGDAILPGSKNYTFWGKGVSQGHSDAIRRIPGVKNAKQYTIPVEKAIEEIRAGKPPELTAREKHTRECFVVLKDGAAPKAVETAIKTMPNYIADYDTTVHIISDEEFRKNHRGMAHGGFVLTSGRTGKDDENGHVIEYRLKLDSNPEFTSSALLCYARAAYRLNQKGESGCRTILDIPAALLSPKSHEELISTLL